MQKNSDTSSPKQDEQKKPKLIVQKYGGATLATPEQIKQAALRIFKLHQTGTQVVAVVSAMGQTTNQLIELARNVSPNPHLRELDMLLTTGERISMSLLSMALNDLGAKAISYTGSQAGILTDDSHVNASIIDVKAFRVEEALKQNKIVILAGFQGVSANTKEITTLGRGGSDTSAVAIAGYLKADRLHLHCGS
jgi:aspartate kinase